MSSPAALSVLVLCLGQTVHMKEEGILPSPSIMAEPSPVIRRGRPVTIVCQSRVGANTFRLEKEGSEIENKVTLLPNTEARFSVPTTTDDSVGHYQCLYLKDSKWSTRSEKLRLVITNEDVTQAPALGTAATSAKPGLKTANLYLLIGLPVAFLLCFLFLLLFWLLQKQQGFLRSKGQQQKPQESPGTDGLERTPDIATVDRLPGMAIRTDTLTSATGGHEEVTYAHLDHQVLTQKASPTGSPRGMVTTAESSMYATLAGH